MESALYSKERIVLAPVESVARGGGDETTTTRRSTVDFHVRFERMAAVSARPELLKTITPHAAELLTKYRAVRIHMQVGSVASHSFPASPLMMDLSPVPGPSGILVSAEFEKQQAAGNKQKAESIAVDRFQALLRDLVGPRRILAAPLGSSMQTHHLHRFLETTTSNSNNKNDTITVTTMLPLEGAAAAFSTEGLRSFLGAATKNNKNESNGIWSVADASLWSSWMLGSVPESLQQAKTASSSSSSSGLDTTSSANSHVNKSSQTVFMSPHHRRSLWMDWRATPACFQNDIGGENQQNDACKFTTQQGLQYTVTVQSPSGNQHYALQDVLPTPFMTEAKTGSSSKKKMLQPDPLVDETSIVLVQGDNDEDDDKPFQWALECQSEQDDNASPSDTVSVQTAWDLSKPCLVRGTASDASPTKEQQHKRSPFQPFWSVYSNALRSIGQAYRGTLIVIVKNDHADCASEVDVVQTLPAVLEPVWQSLTVILGSEKSQQEKIVRWNELQEYKVDFREDRSIQLSFRHSMPPQSSIQVMLDYQPAFLSIESFPGDANRGFEIPPVQARFRGVVALDGSSNTSTCPQLEGAQFDVQLYSNALLLTAPLPDMSMPFNVLSLTCTLYAFVIGSLLNLLIKKANSQLKAKIDPDSVEPDGLLARLVSKLKKLIRRKRLPEPTNAEASTDSASPPRGTSDSTEDHTSTNS